MCLTQFLKTFVSFVEVPAHSEAFQRLQCSASVLLTKHVCYSPTSTWFRSECSCCTPVRWRIELFLFRCELLVSHLTTVARKHPFCVSRAGPSCPAAPSDPEEKRKQNDSTAKQMIQTLGNICLNTCSIDKSLERP